MPTILEIKVSELAAGLDEKASQALVSEIDGISAISILHKLRQRAEQGEVNNPSAFVSTAVRSAKMKGGAGSVELEAAIARLSQDGTLDDNAQEVLRKAPPRDALSGLFALLQMDESNVRNPSAYVTRNVINCKKEGGPPADLGQRMGTGLTQGRQASPQQYGFGGGVDLVSKWMPQLDGAAQDKLQRVGPMAAQQILQEMEGKAAQGQVRNPSGYVSKACDNAQDGKGPPMAQAIVVTPSFQQFGSSPDLLRWHGLLDSDALQALEKIGPVRAGPILENLQGNMGQVRNPSAYVIKSVANLGEGLANGPGAQALSVAVPHPGHFLQSRPRERTIASLDESAQRALQEVGGEAAEVILQEIESKGGSVSNPSAYVTRAVMNARRGEGTAANLATNLGATGSISGQTQSTPGPPVCAPQSHQMARGLDDKAVAALEAIGLDAAASILQQLEAQGGKVNNPSAYVLRAVNNAKRGQGAGGQAMLEGAKSSTLEMLEAWSQKLDADAISALSSVMPDAAASVLSQLEAQWADVKNPSAYVVRAVANSKKGQVGQNRPAGQMSLGWPPPQSQARPPQPQQQGPSAGSGQLDAKALSALEEVGMAAAAVILQKLHAQGGSITNPSAWVIRAVANEKRGPLGGHDESVAKRMRLT